MHGVSGVTNGPRGGAMLLWALQGPPPACLRLPWAPDPQGTSGTKVLAAQIVLRGITVFIVFDAACGLSSLA